MNDTKKAMAEVWETLRFWYKAEGLGLTRSELAWRTQGITPLYRSMAVDCLIGLGQVQEIAGRLIPVEGEITTRPSKVLVRELTAEERANLEAGLPSNGTGPVPGFLYDCRRNPRIELMNPTTPERDQAGVTTARLTSPPKKERDKDPLTPPMTMLQLARLGRRLADHREAYGFTQVAVANMASVKRRVIENLERCDTYKWAGRRTMPTTAVTWNQIIKVKDWLESRESEEKERRRKSC